MFREAVIQTAATYNAHGKGVVEQWMDLIPVFEVCVWDQGLHQGRQQRKPWWRQEALDEVVRSTLTEVFEEARII